MVSSVHNGHMTNKKILDIMDIMDKTIQLVVLTKKNAWELLKMLSIWMNDC